MTFWRQFITHTSSQRGSTTGLVISGYGLSPFIFTSISHFFLAGNTSAFLLLLALGTSVPMIMGFFLVRPIPLEVHGTSDRESHDALEGISSALEPHDSSHTPLLDHDFTAGLHSHSAVLRAGTKSGPIEEEYALDDMPFRSADNVFMPLSSRPQSSDRDVTVITISTDPKLNLHGRQLWTSSDFWLLFTILAIRESCSFVISVIPNKFTICILCSQRNRPDVYVLILQTCGS